MYICGVTLKKKLSGPQCGHSVKRSHVKAILDSDSLNSLEKLSDWLVLYLVAINLDALIVNEIIKKVAA
jgi:hypothetical protein